MSLMIVYRDRKRCVVACDDRATHRRGLYREILRAFIAATS
jgi:hypothetical protein